MSPHYGADGSFARLASALADTHTAVETATGCFFASQPPFRISPPAPIKNPAGKKPSGFLAQMVHSLGSLPRSPTRTRPSKQPPAVSLLRNRPFRISPPAPIKNPVGKSRRDFWRRWRDSNSRGGYPPYALSRGASSPA